MKNLKGTKTEQNLMEAFAGESQARNKYTYFASKAKKEGYNQISELFTETANNEKEHAKIWFKLLNGIGSTEENLEAAAGGENFEWTTMYDRMSKEAKSEGFDEISELFAKVGEIEKEHEQRYRDLRLAIADKSVFEKSGTVTWKCNNCGHTHTGTTAPDVCSVCNHPKGYFIVEVKNY